MSITLLYHSVGYHVISLAFFVWYSQCMIAINICIIQHEDHSNKAIDNCIHEHNSNRWVTFTVTSSRISSIKVALWLQAVTRVYHWVAFTDTSSMTNSMEVAVWLHAKTLVNRWVAFTVISSRIDSMEVALWLHAINLVYQWVAFTDPSSMISSMKLADSFQQDNEHI